VTKNLDDTRLEIDDALDGSDVSLESLALVKFSRISIYEKTFARCRVLQHSFLEQRQYGVLQNRQQCPQPTALNNITKLNSAISISLQSGFSSGISHITCSLRRAKFSPFTETNAKNE